MVDKRLGCVRKKLHDSRPVPRIVHGKRVDRIRYNLSCLAQPAFHQWNCKSSPQAIFQAAYGSGKPAKRLHEICVAPEMGVEAGELLHDKSGLHRSKCIAGMTGGCPELGQVP
jgi:hypothetical protein